MQLCAHVEEGQLYCKLEQDTRSMKSKILYFQVVNAAKIYEVQGNEMLGLKPKIIILHARS